MENSHYDIIFCGGGCAGRSLALHILHNPALQDKSILMLDVNPKQSMDRTWCFWDTNAPEFFSDCVSHWDQMEFCHPFGNYKSPLHPYKYYHLSGKDFHVRSNELLSHHPNFLLKQEKVTQVVSSGVQVRVHTSQGQYTANEVFNSIPFLLDAPPKNESLCLQHFYGWFIQTDHPVFDDKTVRLMDFQGEQKGNPRFFYVLPFDAHRALVEFTVFSNTPLAKVEYQEALKDYLESNFQLQANQFNIEEEEEGIIPMTTHAFPFEVAPHVFNIGTAGGMTKPTTGYTFKTIQQASRSIAHSLARQAKPKADWKAKSRFDFYDRLLIHIIQSDGGRVEHIMRRLFQRNKMSSVLKFLDEASSIGEEIPLFLSLPWKPFLKSLYECYILPSLRPQAHGRSRILDYPNPSYNA